MLKRLFSTFFIVLFSLGLSCAVYAQAPSKLMQESIEISKELRDPGATNQSLYESEAPAAAELKARIYQMLQQGKTKEEILSFFAQRYGEQIRYQPELNASTAVLWILPVCLVLIVLNWILWFVFKVKKRKPANMGNTSGKETPSN